MPRHIGRQLQSRQFHVFRFLKVENVPLVRAFVKLMIDADVLQRYRLHVPKGEMSGHRRKISHTRKRGKRLVAPWFLGDLSQIRQLGKGHCQASKAQTRNGMPGLPADEDIAAGDDLNIREVHIPDHTDFLVRRPFVDVHINWIFRPMPAARFDKDVGKLAVLKYPPLRHKKGDAVAGAANIDIGKLAVAYGVPGAGPKLDGRVITDEDAVRDHDLLDRVLR